MLVTLNVKGPFSKAQFCCSLGCNEGTRNKRPKIRGIPIKYRLVGKLNVYGSLNIKITKINEKITRML